MSSRPPGGGGPAGLGSRSPSATPGWWRWACRRIRCGTSPKRSGSEWPRGPTSSSTTGRTEPEHWDAPFGSGLIHIGVSVFSDSEQAWRQTRGWRGGSTRGIPGVTVLIRAGLRRPAGDLNPAGLQGLDPLPGQGSAVKAGSPSSAFRTVGPGDAIPNGFVVSFYLSDRKLRISVARADGQLYAFDDLRTCAGNSCPLSGGLLTGTTIMCQCHGSEFDVTTGAVVLVVRRPHRSTCTRCGRPTAASASGSDHIQRAASLTKSRLRPSPGHDRHAARRS